MLVISACQPEKKGREALSIPPDTTSLKQLADSGSFLGQDGLDYAPLHTGTFDQLPSELNATLNTNYPGWTLPNLAKEYLEKTKRNHTGPYFLQADFNGDSTLDFAVQYLYKDSIYIKAYLQQPDKKLQEFGLDQFWFKSGASKEESRLYLSLLAKGKENLQDMVPEKEKLPQPAIAVNHHSNSFLYYFDGQKFKKVKWKP